MREPELAGAGRLDRGDCAMKHREETVTLPAGADPPSALPLDDLGEKTIVPLQSLHHCVRHGFPQSRRSLDVGQQERDCPGRQLDRAGLARPGRRRTRSPDTCRGACKVLAHTTARSSASSRSSPLGVAKVRYDTVPLKITFVWTITFPG